MTHLSAFTSRLQPKLRNSLLQRYASDYVRISEHSAAEESLRRGKEQAERAAEKAALLEGFGAAITADENVRLMEHELLRAVACVLECPMPPALGALDPRLLRK